MEQLISDIEAYCAARGITPQRFLREVVKANWNLWQKWKDGDASPTMKVADRLREFMAGGADHHAAGVRTAPADQGDAA